MSSQSHHGPAKVYRCTVFEYQDADADFVTRFSNLCIQVERVITRANINLTLSPNDAHRTSIEKLINLAATYLQSIKETFKDCLQKTRATFSVDEDSGEEKWTMKKITRKAERNNLDSLIELGRWLYFKLSEMKMGNAMLGWKGITLLEDIQQLEAKLAESIQDKKYAVVLQVPPLDGVTNKLFNGIDLYTKKDRRWVKFVGNCLSKETEADEKDFGLIGTNGFPWHML